MIKRRMDAYYYGFYGTTSKHVNKILGAVACAGKAYHHTDCWYDETQAYDDHTGNCPTEWIQNAATEASDEITRLQEQLQWQRFPDEEPDDGVLVVVKSEQASWLALTPTHLTELDEWFVVPDTGEGDD